MVLAILRGVVRPEVKRKVLPRYEDKVFRRPDNGSSQAASWDAQLRKQRLPSPLANNSPSEVLDRASRAMAKAVLDTPIPAHLDRRLLVSGKWCQ